MEVRKIVRIANTDLLGDKAIYNALRKIKGVSFSFSNAICTHLNLDKKRKVGTLTESEVAKIESILINNKDFPSWMLNRQKDYESGNDIHITGAKINLQREFDIKRMQQVKSYKGLRHAWGLPVRGQRTRTHFRHGKSMGVQKKKLMQKPAAKETKEKK